MKLCKNLQQKQIWNHVPRSAGKQAQQMFNVRQMTQSHLKPLQIWLSERDSAA